MKVIIVGMNIGARAMKGERHEIIFPLQEEEFARASHALIGDIFTWGNRMSGSMLFWPFSSSFFGIGVMRIGSLFELGLELALFAIMILMLWSSGELQVM